MKHRLWILSLLLILVMSLASAASVFAFTGGSDQPSQVIAPNPTPKPTTPPDSDGDGLPDSDDLCPNQPGPRENRGCPLPATDTDGDGIPDTDDQCPRRPGPRDNRGCPTSDKEGDGGTQPEVTPGTAPDSDGDGVPDSSDRCPNVAGTAANNGCPPFTPPPLPTDGCYVTPNGDFAVNVREDTDGSSAVLGFLLAGTVYKADGYIMVGTDMWFVMPDYENYAGMMGYASRDVLLASNCGEMAHAAARVQNNLKQLGLAIHNYPTLDIVCSDDERTVLRLPDQDTADDLTAVEPCDGPVNPFDLVIDHDTESGEETYLAVKLENVQITSYQIGVLDNNAVGLILDLRATGWDDDDFPQPQPNDDGTTTVEYCVYLEVKEAGVFEEVCYEVEIPENCVLTTAEAGVYTVECEGEGTVELNPAIEGLPALNLTIPEDSDEGILIGLLLPAVQSAK